MNTINIKMEIKTIIPSITQMVQRNLGASASSYLGNDIYYLIKAVDALVSNVGEDFVKKLIEERGRRWEDVKKTLLEMNSLSIEVKVFYDLIQDKKFEKKEVNLFNAQKMFRNYFKNTAKKIPLMQRELYDLLIILLENTNVGKRTIPSDAWRVVEHIGMSKLDSTYRKPEGVKHG